MSHWEELIRKMESEVIADVSSLKTLKHLWYVPEENSHAKRFNGFVFLGINSGGKSIRDNDHYQKLNDNSARSYYHDEIWNKGKKKGESPLQIQIRLLFLYLYKKSQNSEFKFDSSLSKIQNLNKIESEIGYDKFIKGILAGNICPFQSSSIANLLYPWCVQKKHLIQFWKNIFKNELREETKVIVTMGLEVLDIITCVFEVDIKEFITMQSGWGNTNIRIFNSKESRIPTVINLPHMSRCAIFGRKEGLDYIEGIFKTF